MDAKGFVDVSIFYQAPDIDVLPHLSASVNAVILSAIWTCAPVFIAVISFFVYVMGGNELTISVAFTVRNYLFIKCKTFDLFSCSQLLSST